MTLVMHRLFAVHLTISGPHVLYEVPELHVSIPLNPVEFVALMQSEFGEDWRQGLRDAGC